MIPNLYYEPFYNNIIYYTSTDGSENIEISEQIPAKQPYKDHKEWKPRDFSMF